MKATAAPELLLDRDLLWTRSTGAASRERPRNKPVCFITHGATSLSGGGAPPTQTGHRADPRSSSTDPTPLNHPGNAGLLLLTSPRSGGWTEGEAGLSGICTFSHLARRHRGQEVRGQRERPRYAQSERGGGQMLRGQMGGGDYLQWTVHCPS